MHWGVSVLRAQKEVRSEPGAEGAGRRSVPSPRCGASRGLFLLSGCLGDWHFLFVTHWSERGWRVARAHLLFVPVCRNRNQPPPASGGSGVPLGGGAPRPPHWPSRRASPTSLNPAGGQATDRLMQALHARRGGVGLVGQPLHATAG